MKHVVIIGNGIAGITAARFLRKLSDCRITVVSAESDHFYSRTALMYIYMGHMTYENTKPYEDWFWKKNRIELVRDYVQAVNTDAKELQLASGGTLRYGSLIIATGSVSRMFGWPGQDLRGVQGLYSLHDLATMEEYTNGIERAVIVGGGLIGIEMAEMLHSRHIPVTFLIRENGYWTNILPKEEGDMIARHIREHGIDLRMETEIREILPDAEGRARAVVTTAGEEIPCQFVGLTTGVAPNVEFLKGGAITISRGVVVNDYFETNIPDVYAIGDCAEFTQPKPGHPPIEQLWYTGRMHGEVVAQTICGTRTIYDRGIWFNSAKFLDIEYQTYGFVGNTLRDGEKTLYWEHPQGKKCIRINYSAANGKVLGMNLFGIRYRQAVCEEWMRDGCGIEYVLERLGEANFDPEFFTQYEKDVVALYNSQNPERNLTLKSRRSLFRNLVA